MATQPKDLVYQYEFHFPDKTCKQYTLRIDGQTLNMINPRHSKGLPEWTQLPYHQCPNCPLKTKNHPHCPVAVNLMDIIEDFGPVSSIEEVTTKVTSGPRSYTMEGPIQRGLSALLGLVMATNECPHLAILKPMVRFHLPFATAQETLFRSVATYLTKQFVNYKRKKSADFHLKRLAKNYDQIRIVNRALHKRIQSSHHQDANVNALVILDCFAQTVLFEFTEKDLRGLHQLFPS